MVTRANHMEGLVLPDYFVRVPTIVYTDWFGHRTRLRNDLLEDQEDEQFIICRRCKKPYSLKNAIPSPEDAHNNLPPKGVIWVGYPPNPRGKGFLRGPGIARAWDEAVQKDRIVRMLVIGNLTQAEVAKSLGIDQSRVSRVAAEVSNMLREEAEERRVMTASIVEVDGPESRVIPAATVVTEAPDVPDKGIGNVR